MMNTLLRRLLNIGAIAGAVVLTPLGAFAQDAAAVADNSSPVIGGLVIWLLAAGGILAIIAAFASDRSAQASRIPRR